MKAEQLRKKYLDFFKKKGHTIIPSASLVPSEKVELAATQRVLFTTAGMHPLIPHLLGEPHPHGKRLVNVQKSMRTDDIDEVGDSWHNTFFEMLGNWSLGDYWKKEAIEWSFEFLTKELGLDPEKIYVTVFGGDKEIPGVSEDKESIEIWKSLGIPESRIFKLGKEDNWWGPVGTTGPCGPDTEMFYDTGRPTHGEKCKPGETCGKYAEIWNDVFMEYNKTADGKYEPLKQKNVDTGMGLERTVAILQGKDNAYDTELFSSVMALIKKQSENFRLEKARIIADHLRAAVFLISEKKIPLKSDDDRGYVLVKLITNSNKAAREIDLDNKIFPKVAQMFVEQYKNQYPELNEASEDIKNVIAQGNEMYFQKALSGRSVRKREEEIKPIYDHKQDKKYLEKINLEKANTISGDVFESFNEFHKHHRNSLATVSGTIGTVSADLKMTHGIPIEESFGTASEILGSEFKPEEAKTNLLVMENLQKEASKGTNQKKFAGGLGDHSDITVRGHTATHLLHQALRDVLGNQVHQTGSNITPERIRFDFSHSEKLTLEQIKKVETIVNSNIKKDLEVNKELMSANEADKIGAIGLFKDKYSDKVSIYKIGDYSVEYCGGPHVQHTAEIGKFKIIKEKALGSGQRRIRAILN